MANFIIDITIKNQQQQQKHHHVLRRDMLLQQVNEFLNVLL